MPVIINPIFSTQQEITQKKLQLYTDYSNLLQWGRKNPDQFIEQFLGISYNDAQRYCINNMWGRRHVVLVCCRSFGKSFLTGPYLMSRNILYPNHKTHIIAPTGGQAQETFKKMEDIAKGNIASVLNTTTTFLENCMSQGKNVSPFSHSKAGSKVTLFNGSSIESLVSVPENIVGIRSQCLVCDEGGKISRQMYALCKPFTALSSDYAVGQGLDTDLYPHQLPNQILMISSAEGVN